MAFELVLEAGETVEAQVQLDLSKKVQPFFFAVTNRALYIPRIKLIAKTDPYYLQRTPLQRVRSVKIKRLRPYMLWLLALIMIVAGFWTSIWMMEPILKQSPGTHQVSGWPIAVFICGFVVPFVAKGRFALEISLIDGRYRWKPPLVVDRASKTKIAEALNRIAEACKKVGVKVVDARKLSR